MGNQLPLTWLTCDGNSKKSIGSYGKVWKFSKVLIGHCFIISRHVNIKLSEALKMGSASDMKSENNLNLNFDDVIAN